MTYPKISIGLPTFNRCNGLKEAIGSIGAQSYNNVEIIISDNCSTDDTEEWCRQLAEADARVRYHRQHNNIGMIANFEFVLGQSTGKYFMWIADDDRLEEGVLKKYVSFLEAHIAHSLVSGEIKYWLDSQHDLYERGFTLEQKSSSLRVINYYAKVVYGGMIHGLMRRELAQRIGLRKVIGNDYHFIANLAYLGEFKHFSFVGYHKKLGGTSKDFQHYAHHIGDTRFAAHFPHIKMACDAFSEVMYRSAVFSCMPIPSKLGLASSSFLGMLLRYYGGIFPFVVGGRIIRMINGTKPCVNSKTTEQGVTSQIKNSAHTSLPLQARTP